MNRAYRWWLALAIAALTVWFAPGCKKEASAPQGNQEFSAIPEAKSILDSLEQQKYEDAVAELIKAKDAASTDEQRQQHRELVRVVREKLSERSQTDPKAAEALEALGRLILGR